MSDMIILLRTPVARKQDNHYWPTYTFHNIHSGAYHTCFYANTIGLLSGSKCLYFFEK